jgi:lipoyl-dependent peroxiredoxin subunit D
MFGITSTADNAVALLQDLGINESLVSENLQALQKADSRYLKDVKVSLSTALGAETLTRKEAYLISLSIAVNEKNELLKNAFSAKAVSEGATEKEIAEVISCTSLMNANNIYYRFRHFMHDEFYDTAQAGIRMGIMASPVLGKEFFELLSTAVSAVNGCQMCVTSHEKALLGHGTTKQRIHDAVRLAAVIKSLTVIV